MQKHFLRVEAVNLANVIDDTDDLSTRRGGGLMVLFAPRNMPTNFAGVTLVPISRGASIGLFEFSADSPDDVVEACRNYFQSADLLKYATFVVDAYPIGQVTQETEQWVTAKNHWQQLQSPTMSLVGLTDPATGHCEFDFVRPATETIRLPESKTAIASQSVAQRRSSGRRLRQEFYSIEAGVPESQEFTDHFQEIATYPEGKQHPLNNKLCLFYVDGNKFGSKGRDKFRSGGADGFRTWSDGLQAHHRTLLKALIERTQQAETWQNAGSIRLETLLWGGDEIIWVVPAWKGWELAKWFFSEKHKVGDEQLSYSCGLVFCNAKAPIQNIIKLAKDGLAELVKTYLKKVEKNLIAYEVLESFDDIPNNLEDHRKSWLPKGTDATALLLDPSTFKWDALKSLAQNKSFPRRQLYRYVKAWRSGDEVAKTNALKRLREADTDKQLEEFIQGQDVNYLHLLQMMPYMPEYYS